MSGPVRLSFLFVLLWVIATDADHARCQPSNGDRGERARPERRIDPSFWSILGTAMADPANLGLSLANTEQVQKELQATAEQKAKLKMLREQTASRVRQSMEAVRGVTAENRKATIGELREQAKAQAGEVQKKLEAILQPHQAERLKQIVLQIRGAAALGDEEVQKSLSITADQKQKLKAVRDQSREEMHRLFHTLRDLPAENRPKMGGEIRSRSRQINETAMQRSMEILSSEQREKFIQMKGERFEIDLASIWAHRASGHPPEKPDTSPR